MHGKERVAGVVIVDSAVERTKVQNDWMKIIFI